MKYDMRMYRHHTHSQKAYNRMILSYIRLSLTKPSSYFYALVVIIFAYMHRRHRHFHHSCRGFTASDTVIIIFCEGGKHDKRHKI